MSWECFIGLRYEDGEYEITSAIARFGAYTEARAWMLGRVLPYLDDEEESVRNDGRRALVDLILSESDDSLWVAVVDGTDFLIREIA